MPPVFEIFSDSEWMAIEVKKKKLLPIIVQQGEQYQKYIDNLLSKLNELFPQTSNYEQVGPMTEVIGPL